MGWEDPLEEGMATHYGILSWRIPWTEEPGKLQSIGSQIVRYDWRDLTYMQRDIFLVRLNSLRFSQAELASDINSVKIF